MGGSANGREGGGWYTDAKPEGGGARDRGRRRRAGNERTLLRTYLRDVHPERFFGGRHERRPLVGLDFQTPEGHRAWWGWRRQVRLRVRRNGMRHRFCLQYFSWAQQAFWPRGRWHQPSLAHVDGIVARAKRVDTPGTMAALRAAVRAISVVPLPRPRVTAATSARVLPRVRRLGAVHKWAPGGHRGFCVTARQALSADTTHGALAENTDPHSFEVRETS